MLFLCQGTNYFKILVEKSTVYTSSTGGKVEYVTFDDEKIIDYDATKDLQTELVEPLRDIEVFKEACTIMNDTLAWDITGNRDNKNCIDIDPFTLYEMDCISEKE